MRDSHLTYRPTAGWSYGYFYEGWDALISAYWTIVTITTIGYGDYAPSSQMGRFAMSFYILLCGGITNPNST